MMMTIKLMITIMCFNDKGIAYDDDDNDDGGLASIKRYRE